MSGLLASDDANPQFVGAFNPDQVLHVEFYNKAVEQPFETSRQGHPIWADMVYVRITTPGIPMLNQIDRPMRDPADKLRFPRHWDYFERTQGKSGVIGTPVEQWPFLSKAQAEELKGAKFYTVEMIANASDQQIGSIGMLGGMAPMAMRERARAFLNTAAGNAEKEHLASELAKRDAEMEEMRKQIAALMAAQAAQPTAQALNAASSAALATTFASPEGASTAGPVTSDAPRRETLRKPDKVT